MSKTLRFFAITYLCILFKLSVAMQNVSIDMHEIECFKNAFSVHYLSNDAVAMNSITNFCILDLTTGKIKRIPYCSNAELPQIGNIMIQSNDKKIVLANGQNYMVLDRISGDYFWSAFHKITSLKIGSSNNFWFTIDRTNFLLRCNSDTEDISRGNIECRRVLDIDEKKRKIYIEDCYGDFAEHDLDNSQDDNYQACKTIKIPEAVYSETNILKHRLSSDKSYLACGNALCIYKATIDKSLSCEPFIKSSPGTQFKQMLFLPQRSILATVSQVSDTKTTLQYWDFAQKEATRPIYSFEFDEIGCRDISFSPDGKEGIIAFRGKCIRMSVPF